MASRYSRREPSVCGIWIPPERAEFAWLHGRAVNLVESPTPDMSTVKNEKDFDEAFVCIVELDGKRATVPSQFVFDVPDGTKPGDAFSVIEDPSGDTRGVAAGQGYEVEFGGMVPVWGEGVVDGHTCHYRARGMHWTLEVYAPGDDPDSADPIWRVCRAEYVWPDAGYVRAELSIKHIAWAVAAFRRFTSENADRV